ncbi:MAG: cysteine desulfurase family protein [Bacteroidota bacterium]|nr:cysteine desulfurase [Candidatus Kapabacteria bacterium]MCX7937114.1 cysteine desulfurase [Chlorobiota bacterium]MDW8074607.1 cysteine desulfurase family protein [Bacteroidota bacterium]
MDPECIYLDYHATTPLDERVLAAMQPYFTEHFGNPASALHQYGWKAEAAVAAARRKVADLIGAHDPQEIVFTSGATESVNLALKGVALAKGRGHIITAQTEHSAVLDTCRWLERQGFAVTYLSVDEEGFISLDELERAIMPETILVSVMHANNEVGTIQDIAAIGAICRERGILYHTDATQAVGKIPFDVQACNVDLASFTAHKFYGPKGCGVLYIRKRFPRIPIEPLIHGGGHEFGYRSGTLNVPGIVGLAAALEIAIDEREKEAERLAAYRNYFWERLKELYPEATVNGPDLGRNVERRLPGNLNVSFPGIDAEILIGLLRGVAVSTVSACGSGEHRISHVLSAMGVGERRARSAIRIGIGRYTTSEEIEIALMRFRAAIEKASSRIIVSR